MPIYYTNNYQQYRRKYSIHKSVRFNGIGILFYGNGEIQVGKGTYIGRNSSIQSSDDCKVTIGEDCAISHNFTVYTSNYDPNEIINMGTKKTLKKGNVSIGNNCWIGLNVLILEGVSLGNNVVIGAGSVVTKSIQSNSIAAGVPARIIKKN